MKIGSKKAKWGQNFLKDPKILRKIALFAHIDEGDTVLEIGPGEGTLTEILLEQVGEGGKVIAVEKDRELVEKLKERFKKVKMERLEIVEGDILETPTQGRGADQSVGFENLLEIENYKLVGNIPYYITGEIFKKFLEAENKPESMTFVVQKEVADRIMGSHFAKASRDKSRGRESVLSISVKAYGTPEYGGVIKAGSFSPAPKVDSAIIAVRGISGSNFAKASLDEKIFKDEKIREKKFFEILKRGFAHKRKLLKSNLGIGGATLLACNISEKARAEDLKLDDWICLVSHL